MQCDGSTPRCGEDGRCESLRLTSLLDLGVGPGGANFPCDQSTCHENMQLQLPLLRFYMASPDMKPSKDSSDHSIRKMIKIFMIIPDAYSFVTSMLYTPGYFHFRWRNPLTNLLDTRATYVGNLVISTFISSNLYCLSCCSSSQIAIATDVGYMAWARASHLTLPQWCRM